MDSTGWVMYAVLTVFIALSAFFSASETAFSSDNIIKLKSHADDLKIKKVLNISDNFDATIATILIVKNIINIAAVSLMTILAINAYSKKVGFIITVAVMTFIALTLGEILPRAYANANSIKFAVKYSGVIAFLATALKPIVIFHNYFKNIANKINSSNKKSTIDAGQELKYIIEAIEEDGVLGEQESNLVQSALDFRDITVSEILTPRVDIIAANIDEDVDSITAKVFSERFSRIPVYEKSIDKIIGILNTRLFLEYLVRDIKIDLSSMITKCLYVHKSMKISTLLSEFKRHKMHIAVVTDDYGGTMGIVTMEDILEELVGDIWDEDDEVTHGITTINKSTFEVSGDLNIYDMFEHIGVNAYNFESSYNTMSGWALEEFEHIPVVGESYNYKNLHITVTEVEDNRIIKLLVEINENADTNSDNEEEGY